MPCTAGLCRAAVFVLRREVRSGSFRGHRNTDAISRRSQMSFLLSLLFSINISLDFFKPRAKERKKFNERCVACCGWELTPAAQ